MRNSWMTFLRVRLLALLYIAPQKYSFENLPQLDGIDLASWWVSKIEFHLAQEVC